MYTFPLRSVRLIFCCLPEAFLHCSQLSLSIFPVDWNMLFSPLVFLVFFLRYGILVCSWDHILLRIFFNFILFCILQYLVSINLCLHSNQVQLYDPLLYRHCPSFHAVPKINHNSCITLLNRTIIGFHCCYISLQLLYQAYFCIQNHIKLTDKLQLYWAYKDQFSSVVSHSGY